MSRIGRLPVPIPGGVTVEEQAHTVTVKGPNGYTYSRKVADKKTFDTLKVGDRLDMTWTDALLISVDPPKK